MIKKHAVVSDIRKLNVGDEVLVEQYGEVCYKEVARVIVGSLDDNPKDIVICFSDMTYSTFADVYDLGAPLDANDPDNPYAERSILLRVVFEVAMKLARREAQGWCRSEANTLSKLPKNVPQYEDRTLGLIQRQCVVRAHKMWPQYVDEALRLVNLVRSTISD